MSRVVVLSGLPSASPRNLRRSLETLAATGNEVVLVTFGDVSGIGAAATEHVTIPKPPRRPLPQRPLRVARAGIELVTARRPTDRFRKAVLAHPRVDDLVREAAVVVAMDTPAVDVAWHLTRRHPATPAVIGAPAALHVLGEDPGS